MLTKKEILSYYLEKEDILIMVNHKADGLVLPEYLFGMKNFLSILLDSKNPISLNDDCLETIKSFKGEEMAIKIPYSAIYMVCHESDLFKDNSIPFPKDFPIDFTDLILDMDEENMDVFQTQHEMRMVMIELELQSRREDITIGSWNETSNNLQ